MANVKLRDRDAIVTKEGLIFRVFGYSHPQDAYVCDAEYASANAFKSDDPRALRSNGKQVFYKFYEDEGWKLVQKRFPQHLIFHEMLDHGVIGVAHSNIRTVRKPDERLQELINAEPKDELLAAMHNALKFTTQHSSLTTKNFGVFGSTLHGFHHPRFSDLDFAIYGRRNTFKLRECLAELYEDKSSPLSNEFVSNASIKGKTWRFLNYSPKEYLWHQRRKMIYALFKDTESRRVIKIEFEPVKDWKEIGNEYDAEARIVQRGWVKMLARVTEDHDAPFIPSIYEIEPLEVQSGVRGANEVERIVSYLEEFRMQAFEGETIYIEGNLEEAVTAKGESCQIALTYCPRYYEQVLKAQVPISLQRENVDDISLHEVHGRRVLRSGF